MTGFVVEAVLAALAVGVVLCRRAALLYELRHPTPYRPRHAAR